MHTEWQCWVVNGDFWKAIDTFCSAKQGKCCCLHVLKALIVLFMALGPTMYSTFKWWYIFRHDIDIIESVVTNVYSKLRLDWDTVHANHYSSEDSDYALDTYNLIQILNLNFKLINVLESNLRAQNSWIVCVHYVRPRGSNTHVRAMLTLQQDRWRQKTTCRGASKLLNEVFS